MEILEEMASTCLQNYKTKWGKPEENPLNPLNTTADHPAWIKEASECGGGAFSFSYLGATTGATGEPTPNADVILRSRAEKQALTILTGAPRGHARIRRKTLTLTMGQRRRLSAYLSAVRPG